MNTETKPAAAPAVFATTHWSVVHDAGQEGSPKATEALEQLCRAYWYPLYVYVRRKGYSAHDAEDLTQEFFARLLARNYLTTADRRKGKFRSYLLGAMEHFLAREWRRTHAEKRGGGQAALSLVEADAEIRYSSEPSAELSAERLYDRRWATTVLNAALSELRTEYENRQASALFASLEGLLSGDSGVESYAQLAKSLQMSEGAIKVAVHRFRKRYGELVRAQITQTVATPAEVDEELRYLFAVLQE